MGGMNEAYDAGFAAAARWAMRMDLCSDMDSPAYRATRERAVSRLVIPDDRPSEGPGSYTLDYRAGLYEYRDAVDRKAERDWINHPNTIEGKRQWDAVADALGVDGDCVDSVLAAVNALRADADRYRALRFAYLSQSPAWADIIKQVPVFNQVTFDAAIDKARASNA